MANKRIHPGFLFALLAAILFGASTPAAKPLVANLSPWLVAGLLYLGSGVGLFLLTLILRLLGRNLSTDQSLTKRDLPWLAGATLFGGLLGPLLLMTGLRQTDAATASLLLNVEGVFTALLAWFVFRENFDRRIASGMALILCGGILLSWNGVPSLTSLTGPLTIAAACFCWAIDNNFTRKISSSHPAQIVMVKSLVAGGTNIFLALALGAPLPSPLQLSAAALIGFLGYGLSLYCFVLALRHLGTARTGAYFSLAPFVGSTLSLLFLHEPLTLSLGLAALLMGWGVWLHLTENHAHEHEHDELTHAHSHLHDEHHQHSHTASETVPATEPHSHTHRHNRLRHIHQHFPDMHHHHDH